VLDEQVKHRGFVGTGFTEQADAFVTDCVLRSKWPRRSFTFISSSMATS
jgi:hypothetical protein